MKSRRGAKHGGERCGAWLPRAKALCGKRAGHEGGCLSQAVYDKDRRNAYERSMAKQAEARALRAALLVAQAFLCPCGLPITATGGRGNEALDHDHACCPRASHEACGNCYRGVMHHTCNTAIGLVHENPGRLRALADYLERNGK